MTPCNVYEVTDVKGILGYQSEQIGVERLNNWATGALVNIVKQGIFGHEFRSC